MYPTLDVISIIIIINVFIFVYFCIECHHVPQYVTSGGLGSNASITRSLTRRFGGLNIEEDACRKVDTSTERVLDAPDIVNDYCKSKLCILR